MTKREPKERLNIPTRRPKPKGTMFENLRRPEEVESLSIEEIVTPPTTRPEPIPDQTQARPRPAAPERDFNKRANSLEREALPSGVFAGASKRLYDALYIRTRGAVVAKRTVQATRRELMAWSGIRNIKTINTHLRRLSAVGFIKHTKLNGEHEGSIYEVFLPEEADPDQTQTRPAPEAGRKLVSDQNQNSVWVGSGNPVENKDTSENPKTSFKTNTERDDDEAAPRALREVERELTGKESAGEKWDEVFEVLAAELRIAAARTVVSSAPAFLAEHLRRRLWKKEKKQVEAEEGAKTGAKTNADSSKCPDCGGSGMYYPEGYEKGVAKCRHEKIGK